MTISITISPYPVVGTAATLEASGTSGTDFEWEFTAVPDLSDIDTGAILDASGERSATFTPDVPGTYSVKMSEYVTISRTVPYYGSSALETKKQLLSKTTYSFVAGEELDVPITTDNGDGATLAIVVAGYSVVSAELKNYANARSRSAALTEDVVASVAAIVGYAVSSAGWDIVTRAAELCTNYDAHVNSAGSAVHLAVDTDNEQLIDVPEGVPDAIFALNDLKARLTAHMRSGAVRTVAHIEDDMALKVEASSARIEAQCVALAADIYNVLSEHVWAGPDSFVLSTTMASAGASWTTTGLTGYISNSEFHPRRVGVTTAGSGIVPIAVTFIGLDGYGVSQVVALATSNGAGSKYSTNFFSKMNRISLAASGSLVGTNYIQFGVYPGVHGVADGGNLPAEPKPVDDIITKFLGALRDHFPKTAATDSPGVVQASHRFGFNRRIPV